MISEQILLSRLTVNTKLNGIYFEICKLNLNAIERIGFVNNEGVIFNLYISVNMKCTINHIEN